MPAIKKQLTPKGAPPSKKSDPNVAPAKGGSWNGKISIEEISVDALTPYAKNAKAHPPEQVTQIANSIKEFGFIVPALVDANNVLIAGHGRVLGAKEAGLKRVPVIRAEHLTDAQVRAFRLADNKLQMNSDFLEAFLRDELSALKDLDFDLSLAGFDDDELAKWLNAESQGAGLGVGGPGPNMLADKFMVPPFSVLNAREGWWQDRKRQWIALGIQSELGRGTNALELSEQASEPGLNHYRNKKANAVPGGAPMPLDRAKNKARADA